ncbi:bifunctional phosphopantothenoylcysteine decarboxylase/phosphopantothenate--cysteine ligase CoaBC [Thalassotalea sp. LPB0316]|uniref:bifunctional phosphopantothenoylcysteine decarboxylase/phosphopantothenate--cysteine ligase CoaBC n=1 Tax=Thalassotalea sp. LPB0316 TaxID=2769490 RepID=UPI001868DF11|nr:bifunctional phosphopantothenoylcysteine decarboxylase/phosphopantothenate--cysteine ligase CoaBC [Thalassotalea sp. LPB0316]QOL26459.1 bifunctional phosphopantothenoylcysteine decarboxylase/phosphopantothenate--cysteine ligase CoaBC [Thalassotalea sp. LPB0316]
MTILQGKKILLGVSGGIAAYKTPELVRRLKDQGADVRVVVTQSAKEFVSPLSLQAVSGNDVSESLLDRQAELAMGHIELAKWADFILVAPATANTIAKITHGIADDLLTTVCLASAAPIAIAPAMNQQMWHAKATQENLIVLRNRQYLIFGPGSGDQACGDVGLGRMLDVPELIDACVEQFQDAELSAAGQHWVITAGPTREPIDPVRYISNHSSGKMGYALAQAARRIGAKVTIISGPVNLATPLGCDRIDVESALEMHRAAIAQAPQADVFIACAAVADYRIGQVADQKIKKSQDELTLTLVKNPDIVADVAKLEDKPFVVGFAAETQDVEAYAKGKLLKKNLDMIAANDVAKQGQGFNSDQNALHVFSTTEKFDIALASKAQVAQQLVELIIKQNSK